MYLSIVFMSISAMAKKIPNHINLLKESADLLGQPKCPSCLCRCIAGKGKLIDAVAEFGLQIT